MKATEANLLEFLHKAHQFTIPIFQRTYSWEERECLQLWQDILRTGSDDNIPAHFIGSIVYIQESLYHVSSQSTLLVIDGQQRLTTITLILEALARQLGDTEPMAGFSAKKIRQYYLLNPLEDGESGFKLILTQTDKSSLLALVRQKSLPKEYSLRINANFDFFVEKIKSLGKDLVPLCKGLAKLLVVDISLTRDQDNPQLIFESMNSTGRELSQADLIRNYVLMGLKPDHQTNLYQDHWRPMEMDFGQEAYGSNFDSFMRHYLTVKTGEIPNINRVYESFKKYFRESEIAGVMVDQLIADLHANAEYYCKMELGQEKHKALKIAFQDLRELKVDVAYPFLLTLYADYHSGILSAEDFIEAVRLVESYVFRRAICNIPTNSLNKTFPSLGKEINKEHYLESIQANLLLLASYRRFPDDEEFTREIKSRDLYNTSRRSYWLRRMENFGRKEPVQVNEYTIEHILPQNENLSEEWQKALGPDWKRIQETWLHTLGNLTLTGYNSEYGDRPFHEKRDMEGGFSDSPIKLNAGLGSLEFWNEAAIQKRAEKLAQKAVKVWAAPQLSPESLKTYRKGTGKPASGYTIKDHPHLSQNSPMRPLFEELRKAVLVLDPAVTEEFLKLYVAYKAETNFVDVIPYVTVLSLTLNMKFSEIYDPKGICRNVGEIGRWSAGEVEVKLSTFDELPYVLGLVRQSFEKQMGNGESE